MNTRIAFVLTVGLILAALLNGGIYQVVAVNETGDYGGLVGYRVNRLTGDVVIMQGWRMGQTRMFYRNWEAAQATPTPK
jgi:hypothetical protein